MWPNVERSCLCSQLNATDRDSKNLTKLAYAIVEGNGEGTYAIASDSGLITVQDPMSGLRTSPHKLKVTVTDGLYTTERYVWFYLCGVLRRIFMFETSPVIRGF